MRALVALGAALGLVGAAAAPAAAGTLHFPTPTLLPNGNPAVHPFIAGGEPSLAFDPSGDGHVYVTAPESIPTAVDSTLGVGPDSSVGVGYWASADHGASFPVHGTTGASNGGGDSDVEVLGDHTVLVADLEAAATDICTSHDFAKTFQDCDGGIAKNQQGPENDRQWLTRGRTANEVYLTYHDFSAGYPIIERSTDSGQTFTPCGIIIDPAGPAAANYTPQGGTLVSKPIVSPDGTIYVEFTEPDATASPVGATLDHLYLATLAGGENTCSAASVFTDHLIYEDPGADLGKIFQQTGMDGAGNLYVMAGGQSKAGQSTTNVFLFTSKDKGVTWSSPEQVNPPNLKANVFPTVAGGQGPGEAILGWFGTETSGDPNTLTNEWRYYAAATYDGGQTFNVTEVTPDVAHSGDICTQGVLCGLIPGQPGNRNLADFASAAIDPSDGCAALAVPEDPYNNAASDNGESSAYFTKMDDPSACLTKANAGKNAATVGGTSTSTTPPTVCVDRIPPVSRFTGGRSATRRGVLLRGMTTDMGCRTGGAGQVNQVLVALGRSYAGTSCRYVKANGHFGSLTPCLRTKYLPARLVHPGKSKTAWAFRFTHRLPKGHYVAWVRGIDASANVERKARTRNLVTFRIK